MNGLFNDFSGKKLETKKTVLEILRYMNEENGREYQIVVGTDSESYGGGLADFVTAVVVRRVGAGGRYFWRRVGLSKIHTLRMRIIQEALFSVETAKEILEVVKNCASDGAPGFKLEIHADIGENGETKSMIQEVVGMIRANNFEVKTKPDSYVASKVADRHV